MKVLGIETSSTQASVALYTTDGWSTRRQTDEPQRHAERLMPLIQSCLDEGGMRLQELDRIAVGIGPGSFTGLRVGIALAQGISLGLGVDLVGVPSLLAMACQARESHPGPILVPVVDARRNEVFVSGYDTHGEVFGPWAVAYEAALEHVERTLNGKPFLGVGSMAARLFGEERTAQVGRSPSADALWIARLALDLDPGEVLPLYARDPDAMLPDLLKNPVVHG